MMSMHNTPLTDFEREGLEKHLLAIEYPSQLADVFRQGMAWALSKPQPSSQNVLDVKRYCRLRENWLDSDEINLHGRLAAIDSHIDQLIANEIINAAMKENK